MTSKSEVEAAQFVIRNFEFIIEKASRWEAFRYFHRYTRHS